MADGSVRLLSDSVGSSATEITAEVDLTSAQDNGGELVVLRALVHGVRLVTYAPVAHAGTAGNDVAMEKIVIVHEGITRAGASRLSVDITAQVRALLGAYSWAYLLRRPQALEVYDYPGEYAQRFDGTGVGGKP